MGFDMRMPGNRNEPERADHHGLFSHESQRSRQAEEEEENRDYHSFNAGESIIWWESVKHMPPILQTKKSYAWIVFILIAIIAYSLFTDSPLMAITFILIGMVGYLIFNHPDETVLFAISEKGITAGPEFYDYDSISSFWIIEDHPQFPNHLIIQTGGILSPRVHIPLEDNQPTVVRRILLDFIPEIKYDPNIIDTVERMFHI